MEYKINDLSKKYNISPYTLRYYAKEGLFDFVKRDKNGVRIFREDDLKLLETIECLKKSGMPIKKIKIFVDWCIQGNNTLEYREQMFKEHKKEVETKINELNEQVEFIKYKCWFYENATTFKTDQIFDFISEDNIPKHIKKIIEKEKLEAK